MIPIQIEQFLELLSQFLRLKKLLKHWETSVTTGTLLDTTLTETQNWTLRTLTRHLSLLQPYLTSKGLLKLMHKSYNPTTSALLTNLSLLYNSYWRTSKTKTNRATERQQFIRSNAATARPLILVRPARIWTSDWLNTNERLEMVISTITLLSTIKKNHRIDWDSTECVTYSTDYYQRITLESWFTNLEQTPLNRCQQLPAPYKRLIADNNKTDKQ